MSGQLGDGEIGDYQPHGLVHVFGIATATSIDAGLKFSCALLSDDGVECWGDNTHGQIGSGAYAAIALPVPVSGLGSPVAPGPPGQPIGTGRSAAVVVSWPMPTTDGGSPILAYQVTANPGGTTCLTVFLTCTLTGLTNGTPYTFEVEAANIAGVSAPSTPSTAVTPFGATYVPVTPSRLLDSRFGNGLSGSFVVNVARSFQVTGRGGVPVDAIAVTGNLTVTGQTHTGWLTVTPTLDNSPPTSTLNFPVKDDRANGVTVPLGSGGTLSVVYNGAPSGARTHAVFDVTGYFAL
jgi:hypothetical protein